MIQLADARISEAGVEAVSRVLRSGQLLASSECAAFEEELAEYIGCSDVVAVSSGTAALHLALMALDVGPGCAVSVPDFTFPATANAVAATGARPVIVDVDPDTYTMSPEHFRKLVDSWEGPERLAAVIPVHEFGLCVAPEIVEIAEARQLAVIEDAACALGSEVEGRRAGRLGDMGCFSFHPRKSITTGEGGAISTDDAELAARLRRLRNHGMERVQGHLNFMEIGLNYRLTDFQAALGRVNLSDLDSVLRQRRLVASTYGALLQPLVGRGIQRLPSSSPGHTWQTYMVVLDDDVDRSSVIDALRHAGVESNVGAQSLSGTGLYGTTVGDTVGAALASGGLALPCHQGVSVDDVHKVAKALNAALMRAGA